MRADGLGAGQVRDSQRIKDKYELSLDNRQVVSLFIAGLVVMGTVFVLGVVVGKNLAGSQKSASAPDLLSALDQKAAAMEHVRTETRLTFQDELTKKALPEANRPAQPSPEPSKPVPSPVLNELTQPTGDSARAGTAQPAQPGPLESLTASAPSKTGAQPAPPIPLPTDGFREVKMEALPEPTAKTPRAPAPAPSSSARLASPAERPASRSKPGLADAIARVERTPAQKPESKGPFTLQLSASQVREDADRFAAKVREKGYQVYVIQSEVPGRGRWYRVRLGKFPTREAAARYLRDFQRETHLSAFLTRTDES